MRILEVKQLKPIQLREKGFKFPVSKQTIFILDKKSPSNKKHHQLVFQQGDRFGLVGDFCAYLSNDELFELEKLEIITVRKSG